MEAVGELLRCSRAGRVHSLMLSFIYEATSPDLRLLLASPALQTTLTRLTALPPSAREPSLRLLLGLTPSAAGDLYRPEPSHRFASSAPVSSSDMSSRGTPRGRGRGRGRGGRGGAAAGGRDGPQLLGSTPEERQEMVKFAEEVQSALEVAREKRGERS